MLNRCLIPALVATLLLMNVHAQEHPVEPLGVSEYENLLRRGRIDLAVLDVNVRPPRPPTFAVSSRTNVLTGDPLASAQAPDEALTSGGEAGSVKDASAVLGRTAGIQTAYRNLERSDPLRTELASVVVAQLLDEASRAQPGESEPVLLTLGLIYERDMGMPGSAAVVFDAAASQRDGVSAAKIRYWKLQAMLPKDFETRLPQPEREGELISTGETHIHEEKETRQ